MSMLPPLLCKDSFRQTNANEHYGPLLHEQKLRMIQFHPRVRWLTRRNMFLQVHTHPLHNMFILSSSVHRTSTSYEARSCFHRLKFTHHVYVTTLPLVCSGNIELSHSLARLPAQVPSSDSAITSFVYDVTLCYHHHFGHLLTPLLTSLHTKYPADKTFSIFSPIPCS